MLNRIQSPLRIALVALALGLIADLLFYKQAIGVSVLVFVLFFLGALFLVGGLERVRTSGKNLWLIGPLLFFAAMIFVRANPMLTFFNICAVLGLLGLLLFFYAADNLDRLGMFGYPVIMALTIWNMLTRPAQVVRPGWQAVAGQKHRVRLAVPLVRGIALAIPVLIVFTVLLSSADKVFADYTNSFFKLEFINGLPNLLWQLVIILTVAWLTGGGYIYAVTRHRPPGDAKPRSENLPGTVLPGRLIGFVEGATILVLVDLLFIGFAWIQVTYLFSGEAQRTLSFEGYRDYVRRGFLELLIVCILTMCLILGLRWATRHFKTSHEMTFKLLATLMIVLAGVMLLSAFQRMLVWENVDYYINTQVRLYVRAFIIWLSITLIWLLFTLWMQNYRFALGAFLGVMGFFITLNFMNPDADVAAYNLSRRDELSVRYLYTMSDDAIPVLAEGLDQLPDNLKYRLQVYLSERLYFLERDKSWRQWPGFHVARWQAYDHLVKLRDEGKLISSVLR